MVTTTAVPIAPASWRTVLTTAEPCDPNRLGNAFNADVLSGIVMKLKPIRKMMVRIIKYMKDVEAVKSVTAHIEGIINKSPIINNGFAPTLSYNLPVTGDNMALMTAPGNNKRPASNAVNPLPV